MKKRINRYFLKKKIREDSILYLLIKGIGGFIGFIIAIIIAWTAVGSYNIGNTIRLSEELSKRSLESEELKGKINILTMKLQDYESKRFILRNGEVRNLFSDIYISFEDYPANLTRLSIRKKDSVIVSLVESRSRLELNVGEPIMFSDGQNQCFLMIERRYPFTVETGWHYDSILVYWDSLETRK